MVLIIPINAPSIGSREARTVSSVLRTGKLSSSSDKGGAHVRAFEAKAASYLGAKYVVAVNSGTAALQASLYALGIGKGDEVLIPSFTFVATANAVVSTGAKPVFVDITRDSYTMDPQDAEKKITKKTRGIIPAHLYGNAAPINEISEIAARRGLHVIEDAAQSLGTTFRGRHTGTFSELGCFSMYPGKVITAGEGGFVATSSRRLRDRLAMIRNHGFLSGRAKTFGLNLRLAETGAAIASVQLERLPGFLRKRRSNAALLTKLISDMDLVVPSEPQHTSVNWSLYTIAVRNRDKILRRLNKAGVQAAAYYRQPVHKCAPYLGAARLPVTERAASRVLSLPVHPGVSKAQIEFIAKTLRDVS